MRGRPLRVVHVSERWVGGVGTYLEGILTHQLACGAYSGVHLIYDPRLAREQEVPDGVVRHGYTSGRSPVGVLAATLSVQRAIARIDPDIVHLHSTFPGIYGRLLRISGPARRPHLVYCPHGWAFAREVSPRARQGIAFVERLLAGRTATTIHISEHERRVARDYRVSAAADVTILHGAREVRRIDSRQRPDDGPLIVGFVGRLDRQKGFDVLVDALARCQRRDIVVMVAGAPELDDQSFAIPPPSSRYRYLGWIPNAEIDDVITGCDVVVVPSRWEGFGLVALEVMRNARPLIVSNRGALPEIVRDGVEGFVFDPADPDRLAEILDRIDRPRLRDMGASARARFEQHFTLERSLSAVDGVYRRLVENASSRRPAALREPAA